jgi:hypothetical protein
MQLRFYRLVAARRALAIKDAELMAATAVDEHFTINMQLYTLQTGCCA